MRQSLCLLVRRISKYWCTTGSSIHVIISILITRLFLLSAQVFYFTVWDRKRVKIEDRVAKRISCKSTMKNNGRSTFIYLCSLSSMFCNCERSSYTTQQTSSNIIIKPHMTSHFPLLSINVTYSHNHIEYDVMHDVMAEHNATEILFTCAIMMIGIWCL